MTETYEGTQSRLLLLGLPEKVLDKKPEVTAYAPKLSTLAMYLWVKLFDNPRVLTEISSRNASSAWNYVFKVFLLYCRREGVEPFVRGAPEDKIEYVVDELRRIRYALVTYCAKSKFFVDKRITLKVNSTTTKVQYKNKQLRIFVASRVFRVSDPDLFHYIRRMPYPRLFQGSNRVFYRDIYGHKVRFWVQYLNNLRIFMGYDITRH